MPSLSSSSSALNPVARETVALAFQLSDYLASDHSFTSLFDESTRKTIKHIVLNNFRPPSVSPDLPRTAREECSRARSESVKEPSWPASWGHDKLSLRASLKVFKQDTKALRQLLELLAATGATPSGSSNPSRDSQSPSSDPSQNSQDPSSDHSTRQTSTSMPPQDDQSWQDTRFSQQQWGALQHLL